MHLKRRDFLLAGGVTGLGGLAWYWRMLAGYAMPLPGVTQLPEGQDFSSAKGDRQPLLRFVMTADSGSGDLNQYAVGKVMAAYHRQYPFPLALLAGDNIYTNGEMEKIEAVFERPYQALLQAGVKFHACLGNHDIRTANGDRQIRYAPLNMAGRYYTVRQGPVQFFALDTNHNADWRSQHSWLAQALGQSDAPWKVVFGHHPIYSSGRYGTNPSLISRLSPLFTQHGVQLYLNGHEHDYERSRPIRGTTYLVCGIGGARLRPVGRSPWTACAESRFGFTAFEVYEQAMEIRAIGTDGRVFDRATLSRQSV